MLQHTLKALTLALATAIAPSALAGQATTNPNSERLTVAAGAGAVVPYAFGGAGAISVHQLGSDSTWTKFAGTFGAGLELRLARWGFRAEGRDHVYKFDRYGFDKVQHDIAWQGGVTLSF